MRWIKASETKSEDFKAVCCRIDIRGNWFTAWYDPNEKDYVGYSGSLAATNRLEWLDESQSPAPSPQPGGEVKDCKPGSIGWFVQDIDIILDYAISDKEKVKMIQAAFNKLDYSSLPASPAQSEGVEFAEWIALNYNIRTGLGLDGYWWYKNGSSDSYTTSQLYTIFQQQKPLTHER